MNLADFTYELPKPLIAQYPLRKRDAARLLVVRRLTGEIIHDRFSNLGKYLPQECVLVVNDTKVTPARLLGTKEFGGREVEVFLLKKLEDGYSYQALFRPLKKIQDNERIFFKGTKLVGTLADRKNKIVRFNRKDISREIKRIGHMPLPPYIRRSDEASDKKDYQTVYAKKDGSVAAPTAGLHFTQAMLKALKRNGHDVQRLTLHINHGTFQPIKEEDITRHPMHAEAYAISPSVFRSIQGAREKGRSVVCVGTTSCRVLETVAQNGMCQGETDLYIYPGFKFQMTDALLTNFHLPQSTLFVLACAFAGRELMLKAYREAIERKYRFYSYGDCTLIL